MIRSLFLNSPFKLLSYCCRSFSSELVAEWSCKFRLSCWGQLFLRADIRIHAVNLKLAGLGAPNLLVSFQRSRAPFLGVRIIGIMVHLTLFCGPPFMEIRTSKCTHCKPNAFFCAGSLNELIQGFMEVKSEPTKSGFKRTRYTYTQPLRGQLHTS